MEPRRHEEHEGRRRRKYANRVTNPDLVSKLHCRQGNHRTRINKLRMTLNLDKGEHNEYSYRFSFHLPTATCS